MGGVLKVGPSERPPNGPEQAGLLFAFERTIHFTFPKSKTK